MRLLAAALVMSMSSVALAQLEAPEYRGAEKFETHAPSSEAETAPTKSTEPTKPTKPLALSHEGEPHRLRAAIEVGLVLTFATVRYQFDGTRKENFDFPSLKQRFNGEAWRYDNNPFGINNIWHTVEGAFFHVAARSNNLSLSESFVVGFLSSFAWEFGFEFNEKVSINDVWFTPTAGVAVGEFVHWLGRYLDSAPANASLAYSVARWTLGFPYAIHRRLDGTGPRRIELDDESDNLGLTRDIWHRFSIGITGSSISADSASADSGAVPSILGSARATARLAAFRRYRQAGKFEAPFASGNFTEASYELTRGSDSNGSRFRAESVLAGLYRQAIDEHGHGRGTLIGVAVGYDYRKEQLGSWRDRNSLLHFPGLAIDGEFHTPSSTFRTGLRVHGDFVSMEAPSNSAWREANPGVVGKTIVDRQGYFFGWGGSVRLEAALEIRAPIPIEIAGTALFGHHASHEGLDRNQSGVEVDVEIDSTMMDLDGRVSVGVAHDWPSLELRVSHQRRETNQEGFGVDRSLTRIGLGIHHRF